MLEETGQLKISLEIFYRNLDHTPFLLRICTKNCVAQCLRTVTVIVTLNNILAISRSSASLFYARYDRLGTIPLPLNDSNLMRELTTYQVN